jgi:hypothetical protein
MRIREYTPHDLEALRRMHAAQNFGYPFPDIDSPLFVTKLILEDDADEAPESSTGFSLCGFHNVANTPAMEKVNPSQAEACATRATAQPRIAMAVLLRLTAETYLLHDPAAGTPRQRWQRFLALHDAARNSAAARGLDDVQAFLPPRVARAFGRRLGRLGWTRDPWHCFSCRVVG